MPKDKERKVIEEKNILLHTCRPQGRTYEEKDLTSSPEKTIHYFPVDNDFLTFRLAPEKCKCRKKVSLIEAQRMVANGKVQYFVKKKNGYIVLLNGADKESECKEVISHVERGQTPRIDAITAADVERAFIGSSKKIQCFSYNPKKKKFVVIKTIPEGVKEQDAPRVRLEMIAAENEFERKVRKKYRDYINMSHELAMEFRRLMFRGIVLENGKQVAGEKQCIEEKDDYSRGHLLVNQDADNRTSVEGFSIDELKNQEKTRIVVRRGSKGVQIIPLTKDGTVENID